MQRRLILTAIAALLGMAVTAQAAGPGRSQRNKLTQTQEAYVAAVRWSDFEGAERFIDPAYWQAHPLTDLQRERYRQVQVSNYRERSTSVAADGAIERRVEMGVINRNTLAERTLMVTERWRWDPEAKRWWQVQGLPDLWQGQ
ncbi:hypothetical protein GXB84_13130 [Stenotrophomonas acidaminiphila]|uniref:hypothetical protein n=1 Tax=Stenotrophomonas TaxID=40323 RepID=UPI000CDBFAD0|nr:MULTISPECIES: hypothetical protein [Stenotrophomonas]AUZ53890.1 hypothetical protein B1L07_00680 [Stenotrophomonas acidaminiphila]MCH1909943.1 hypothetical protein [Stenotrophomonas sp. Y6]MPS36979.1 hypothetical protein [Stenotrophomonas sp.]MTI73851.1 hypothetical protein [Stenotrophomonas sp.]NCT88262.1 hypothetical protein [Stenotrophomonas acidaminiphila]